MISKIFQNKPKQSKRFQNHPKDVKRIQKILNVSKRVQKRPKDSRQDAKPFFKDQSFPKSYCLLKTPQRIKELEVLTLLEPTSLSKQTKNVNTNEFQACYFIKTNFSQAVDDIVANGAMAMKMKAYMEDKLRDCTASQLKNKDTSCIVRLYDFAWIAFTAG